MSGGGVTRPVVRSIPPSTRHELYGVAADLEHRGQVRRLHTMPDIGDARSTDAHTTLLDLPARFAGRCGQASIDHDARQRLRGVRCKRDGDRAQITRQFTTRVHTLELVRGPTCVGC